MKYCSQQYRTQAATAAEATRNTIGICLQAPVRARQDGGKLMLPHINYKQREPTPLRTKLDSNISRERKQVHVVRVDETMAVFFRHTGGGGTPTDSSTDSIPRMPEGLRTESKPPCVSERDTYTK